MKKSIFNKQGFTLIELLVVIAIIGIISSIVIVVLSISRDKGKEGSARYSLSQGKTEIELAYYNNSNSYIGICPTDVTIPIAGAYSDVLLKVLQGVSQAFSLTMMGGGGVGDNYDTGGPAPNRAGDIGCQTDSDEYMLQVYINSNKTICVDESGVVADIAIAKATNLASGLIKCN